MAAEAEAAREARAKVSERATWDDPGVASVTELQKREAGQKRRWGRKIGERLEKRCEIVGSCRA